MPQQKPSSAHPDPALITQYYQGDEGEYLQDERAIILLGWKPLIQQFVQMIPFPRILQSQLAIRVLPPFTITYDTDYLIISSQNFGFFPPTCPASVGTHYSVRAEHKRLESKTQGSASFACEAKLVVTGKSASAQCNEVLTDAAMLFLYLPRQITLLKYVSDVLSPAIAANDSGTFALVRWYYNLSASLKQASLTLDFTPPVKMLGSATFHAAGNAGANVEIGCIEYSIANVGIDSSPDYDLSAILSTCIENNILYLDASFNIANGQIHFYGLGFPLDTIINFVMRSVGDRLFRGMMNRALSGFKIQLLDFSSLFAGMQTNAYKSEAQVQKESGIFGLMLSSELADPDPPHPSGVA